MCERSILAGLENPLTHGLDPKAKTREDISTQAPADLSTLPEGTQTDFAPDITRTVLEPRAPITTQATGFTLHEDRTRGGWIRISEEGSS